MSFFLKFDQDQLVNLTTLSENPITLIDHFNSLQEAIHFTHLFHKS